MRGWWADCGWKRKTLSIIGAVLLALFLIGLLAPPPEEVASRSETTTVVVTETTSGDSGDPESTEGETTTQQEAPEPVTYAVAEVTDGDTIRLQSGDRVRLVQIDAPELRGNECYARRSASTLRSILRGARVRLETDRRLDNVDQYGRLLRYVHKGETNVNLALVRRGAASVWFFDGDRGKYARKMLAAARQARKAERGLWRTCSATKLRPFAALATAKPAPPPAPAAGTCEDVTSYDYNWDNDMKCTRSDGSTFYTDYAGADRFERYGDE